MRFMWSPSAAPLLYNAPVTPYQIINIVLARSYFWALQHMTLWVCRSTRSSLREHWFPEIDVTAYKPESPSHRRCRHFPFQDSLLLRPDADAQHLHLSFHLHAATRLKTPSLIDWSLRLKSPAFRPRNPRAPRSCWCPLCCLTALRWIAGLRWPSLP